MEEALKESCWEIVKSCLKEDDFVHGVTHIKNVYKNFELLKKTNSKVNNEVLDALEFAVMFHDIGMRDGRENHAQQSVEILTKEYPELFSQLPHKEWIQYAVSRHSMGGDKLLDEKGQCLALLMAVDNMESLGEEGLKRDRTEMNGVAPESKHYAKEQVEDAFNGLAKPNKQESLLARLLSNGYYAKKNLDCIGELLSEEFEKEYIKRIEFTKHICLELIAI